MGLVDTQISFYPNNPAKSIKIRGWEVVEVVSKFAGICFKLWMFKKLHSTDSIDSFDPMTYIWSTLYDQIDPVWMWSPFKWWKNGGIMVEVWKIFWQVASCKDHILYIMYIYIIIYVYTCIQNKPRIQKATCHSALCYHPLEWTDPYLGTTWTITLPLRTLQVTSSCSSCHSTPQVLAKTRSPCGVMASLWGTIAGRLLNLGGCLKWSTKWLDKFVCVNARQAMSQFRKPHQLGRLFEGFWLLG